MTILVACHLPLLVERFHLRRSRRPPLQVRSLPSLRRSRHLQNRQGRRRRLCRWHYCRRRRRRGQRMSPATRQCRRHSAASGPPSPPPGSAPRQPGTRDRSSWSICNVFHLDRVEEESQKRKRKKKKQRRRRRLSIGQSGRDAAALPFSSLFSPPQRESSAKMVPISFQR